MSRITIGCAGACLAVLLCMGFYGARAQEREPVAPVSPQKVTKPKAVASADLQGKTPRLIAIDLLIAEAGPGKGEGAKPGPDEKQFDARDLSGPMGDVQARVEALKKTGQISYFRRIQLSTAENQTASVSIGEMRPVVAGLNTSATGHLSRSISYVNTGTNVKVTARVTTDGQVLMDLNLDDTRGHVPEDGVAIGTDEKGQPIRAEERIMAKLTTTLSVASGRAKAAQVVTTSSKSGQAQTLVIVGARIVEP
jgi:Bacterial type II and III secretion system protein